MVCVSIVIACKNMERTLGDTLAGIAQQEWDRPWEVILADNGSTDGSAAIFTKFAAANPTIPARLVDASAKRGKSHALNQAVAVAEGKAILLNDADDMMAPGYVATLASALDSNDLVGGGNDLLKLNERWVLRYCDRPDEVRELSVAYVPPFLPFVGGNSMGFTKALFDRIGGFRAEFEPWEDMDFCFRAQLAGYRVEYVPDATIHYRFRADRRSIRRQAYGYAEASVKMGKSYRSCCAAAPRRWRRFLAGWRSVAVLAVRVAASGRTRDPEAQALLSHKLGWQLGKTAGVIKHWAPPR